MPVSLKAEVLLSHGIIITAVGHVNDDGRIQSAPETAASHAQHESHGDNSAHHVLSISFLPLLLWLLRLPGNCFPTPIYPPAVYIPTIMALLSIQEPPTGLKSYWHYLIL